MNPAISYIIASVQRSGTHLLCSILRSTGIAGTPEEHFLSKPGETWEKRWGAPSRVAYVQNVLRQNTAANGVFGAVVMWSYFERMLQMLQEIPTYKNLNGAQLLAAVFNTPKYIWMRRRNHVEQAVSWAMASQTGIWAQTGEEKLQPPAVPKFDFKVIDEWCNRIAAHDDGWASYFLELPFPPDLEIPLPAVEKQANQISHEWAACYLKLKGAKTGRFARVLRRMRA